MGPFGNNINNMCRNVFDKGTHQEHYWKHVGNKILQTKKSSSSPSNLSVELQNQCSLFFKHTQKKIYNYIFGLKVCLIITHFQYLPIYLPSTYLCPTYLHAYLHTIYLPMSYLPTYLSIYLPFTYLCLSCIILSIYYLPK